MRHSVLALLLNLIPLTVIASQAQDNPGKSVDNQPAAPRAAPVAEVAAVLQQQTGTANATGDTRADACELAQARARSSAEQSCDARFDIDDCRCSRNAGRTPAFSCSARWRCQSSGLDLFATPEPPEPPTKSALPDFFPTPESPTGSVFFGAGPCGNDAPPCPPAKPSGPPAAAPTTNTTNDTTTNGSPRTLPALDRSEANHAEKGVGDVPANCQDPNDACLFPKTPWGSDTLPATIFRGIHNYITTPCHDEGPCSSWDQREQQRQRERAAQRHRRRPSRE